MIVGITIIGGTYEDGMNPIEQLCRMRELNERLEDNRERLYRIAFAWSHNEALSDDLVQETMAKALRRRGQLRDLDSVDGWLFRILANNWRDYFRRQKDTEDIDNVPLATAYTPESIQGQREVVHRVRYAVAQLPDGQRQVLTLVDLEEFSYSEVAEILEIPIGTVMSRLCRARKQLKAVLLDNDNQVASAPRIRRVK
jgi:RNA polymerase sigma-70 factor (ECF subfamily)